MTNYPKGSEWRLWDLHIHTPASYNYDGATFANMTNEQQSSSLKQIIQNINQSDVSVYAINDYWTFDGYIMLRDAEAEDSPIHKTIFPGIEIRLEAASDHRLNAHIVFSDQITNQELIDFKSALKIKLIDRSLSNEALVEFGRQLPQDKAREHAVPDRSSATEAELFELGAKTAEITRKSLEEAVSAIPSHKRLIMFPYSCYGGAEEINWREQPTEDLYLLRLADIFEDRNQNNIKLFAGIKTEQNATFIDDFQETIGGHPKPCISGSDGHSINSFLTWRPETQRKKTWIKADPTFEGLRQILFEPYLRVKIQEESPLTEFSKPFFGSISITDDFSPFPDNPTFENPSFKKNEALPLNRDLSCIIGGRGTGKSTLINYIGEAFGAKPVEVHKLSNKFEVTFNKDLTTTSNHTATDGDALPFVYISQNEVKNKIDTGTVGDEIKKMLGISNLSFDSSIHQRTSNLIKEVEIVNNWFSQQTEDGELIYEENSVKKKLDKFNSLLEATTTDENKDKLEKFTGNISSASKLTKNINKANSLIELISNFTAKYNEKAEALDPELKKVELKDLENDIRQKIDIWNKRLEEYQLENDQIKNDFSGIYKGNLTDLLENVEKYRNAIEILQDRLLKIKTKNGELKTAKSNLKQIPHLISTELERIKSAIDEKWLDVSEGGENRSESQKSLMKKILNDRNIHLEGQILFDKNAFIELAKRELNLRSFRATNEQSQEDRIEEYLEIHDLQSYFKFMEEKLYDPDLDQYVSGNLRSVFNDISIRTKYLKVTPVISYDGRPLEHLSVGQKGTVYLCLKLATQPFTQPLIFDQPEDDLDNEFIIEELVDIFKSIKQFRQVIIVTHNANLVVNSDTEQVIVSSNDRGNIQYESGSLENEHINKQIRRILEGGDTAFLKREKRYNINHK